MELSAFFKAVVEADNTSVVICDTDHTIVYMNPAAVKKYGKRGGQSLVGSSLLDCHNEDSNRKIKAVVRWFGESAGNDRVFTFHNQKENRDVYMIALRNDSGELIGYYEKHEFRTCEQSEPYEKISL